jgi:hypothetical protein
VEGNEKAAKLLKSRPGPSPPMRILWLMPLLLLPLTGCFGPYASDLELPPPPERPASGHWRVAADGSLVELQPHDLDIKGRYKLTGHIGAEPNLGVTESGAIFMTSLDQTLRSRDGGKTWDVVYDFQPSLADGQGTETGDPMLWVDATTNRVYTNHMYPALLCFFTAWSADDGEYWDENEATCTLPGVDHQKFFSAPPGPLAPAIAGRDHPSVLYQCYQRYFHPSMLGVPDPGGIPPVGGMTTHCNMSYDGGRTWPAETLSAARLPASCGGINGHPASNTEGVVAIPITRGCDGLYISISLDSGLTWTVRPGPKDFGAESIDPEVSFAPDGSLYAFWRGLDHLVYFARSPDLGLTWAGPWRVSPPDVRSTVFQAMAAGEDGRAAMAFLGTFDTDAHPSDAPEDTVWHLFLAHTDGAASDAPEFVVHQVTGPADPVQIGCVWLFGGGHPCRNMLDFIDGAVAPDGTFYTAFTKGCTSCIDDSNTDRASLTALATLHGFKLKGDQP